MIKYAFVIVVFASTHSVSHELVPAKKVPEKEILAPSSKRINNSSVAGGVNAVVNAYKLWRAGQTITACFEGGEMLVRELFVQTEREWEALGNIKWDFGSAPNYTSCNSRQPSHIRISFLETGHWSRVGTDSINTTVIKEPSLNIDIAQFGPFSLADKGKIRAVMLHEQGHALGLEHEHQSPKDPCISKIKWQLVYKEMAAAPNNWDAKKVDTNYRAIVNTERMRVSEYDRKSIMHYSFPARWFDSESCAVQQNDDISDVDKIEIAKAYPSDPVLQGKYISELGASTDIAIKSLNLTKSQTASLVNDINNLPEALLTSLRSAAAPVALVRDNSGVIINNSSANASGCSAIVMGTQGGAVTVNNNCRQR